MGVKPGPSQKQWKTHLDDTYTRMLRKSLNVHWSDRVTSESLYGKLPRLSDKIAARRLRLAGGTLPEKPRARSTSSDTVGTNSLAKRQRSTKDDIC